LFALLICRLILRIFPQQGSLRNSCDILKIKLSLSLWVVIPTVIIVWGGTNCNDRGVALVEFLNSTDLEILNRDNDPTSCNSRRLDVIDTTLRSFELLQSIKDWEVSSEPSLADHRHIIFKLAGSVPAGLFRHPRSTNWDSFWEICGAAWNRNLRWT
jgi:hypothetical protein